MPKGSELGNRDTVSGGDRTYVFTDASSYQSTFDNIIEDLGLARLSDVVGGGTGDVIGPAGATDGVPMLANGTTGKVIKAGTPEQLVAAGAANGKFYGYSGDAYGWLDNPVPPGGTDGQALLSDGSGGRTWGDVLPTSATTSDVLTWDGSAWVSGAPPDASVTSASIGAAIEAETNVITDVTPTTYMLVIQDDGDGGWTVGKIDIGGGAASFDPSTSLGTDGFGNIQSVPYDELADAAGLGSSSDVQFGSVSIGDPDTTLTRASAGVVAVEGADVVLSGSTPQFAAIELSHASANTLSGSGGVASIEGHAIVTKDQSAALSAGFSQTEYAAGTKTTGTFTPDIANGAIQAATNGGAHTLAPPSANCSLAVVYTNNGSAGAITTSGFTKVDGDSFTTTSTHKFICSILKTSVGSWLTVKAMQ